MDLGRFMLDMDGLDTFGEWHRRLKRRCTETCRSLSECGYRCEVTAGLERPSMTSGGL